ncbi:uncharacterized protein LOC124289242 [Haliotis rubra]|uniref:uncharacterized protein LOC124289242 n=1 Tax=Haliotis rubra TaxID=36100 RepID=UPI001EE5C829|nr:uncharacterized protein LOC124289242 [Haliotis rubra]
MSSSVSQALGDKGNPYHKKDLDKSEEPKMSKSTSSTSQAPPKGKTDIIEPVMSSSVSQALGDQGNPHYKAKLDKSKKSKGKESKSQKTTTLTPATQDPLMAQPDIIEPVMASSTRQALGDRGNPYYKKNLDKQSRKDTAEDEVKPATAQADKGDKGMKKRMENRNCSISIQPIRGGQGITRCT